MVYQGATGLYHFLINVIPFISNSVGIITFMIYSYDVVFKFTLPNIYLCFTVSK